MKKYNYTEVAQMMDRLRASRQSVLSAKHKRDYQATEQYEVGMMQEAMETGQLPEGLKQRMPRSG